MHSKSKITSFMSKVICAMLFIAGAALCWLIQQTDGQGGLGLEAALAVGSFSPAGQANWVPFIARTLGGSIQQHGDPAQLTSTLGSVAGGPGNPVNPFHAGCDRVMGISATFGYGESMPIVYLIGIMETVEPRLGIDRGSIARGRLQDTLRQYAACLASD